ncbi:hypothetical protein LX32DRAFT_4241 [Colletotrichum zoysiae]|uniref:Uncharacterized protein n=1 Tax=Colletotrichum zoysiae TaxID=1216348 RepID=A0AAD9HUV7_9PEZI|nr:hypothetical protein LX32DRAFT_4241 [Colletotrichum zoysiae]
MSLFSPLSIHYLTSPHLTSPHSSLLTHHQSLTHSLFSTAACIVSLSILPCPTIFSPHRQCPSWWCPMSCHTIIWPSPHILQPLPSIHPSPANKQTEKQNKKSSSSSINSPFYPSVTPTCLPPFRCPWCAFRSPTNTQSNLLADSHPDRETWHVKSKQALSLG